MKQFLTTLIFSSIILTSYAQSWDTQNFNSPDGRQELEITSNFQGGRKILERPDGSLLVCATYGSGSQFDVSAYQIVCIDRNGFRCNDFGTNGAVNMNDLQLSLQFGTVTDFVLQSSGKILISGLNNVNLQVLRLNADGSLDSSFGNGGATIYQRVANDTGIARNLTLCSLGINGFLLVNNYRLASNINFGRISVYKADNDGNLDPNFGINGILEPSYNFETYFSTFKNIDDNIFISSTFAADLSNPSNYQTIIQKHDLTGGLVANFGNNGSRVISNSSLALKIDITDAGKIGLAGTASSLFTNGIAQVDVTLLNSDGSLDTTFSPNGFNRYIFLDDDDNAADDIEIQPDGKVLVMFNEGQFAPNNPSTLQRLNTDGTIDTSFGNSVQTPPYSFSFRFGFSNMRDMLLFDNGDLYVTGKVSAVRDGNGSNIFVGKVLIPDAVLSQEDISSTSLGIYPNPTSGLISIDSSKTIDQVELFDLQGRMVFKSDQIQNSTLDFSQLNLGTGTYLLHLFSGGDHHVEKIVIEY